MMLTSVTESLSCHSCRRSLAARNIHTITAERTIESDTSSGAHGRRRRADDTTAPPNDCVSYLPGAMHQRAARDSPQLVAVPHQNLFQLSLTPSFYIYPFNCLSLSSPSVHDPRARSHAPTWKVFSRAGPGCCIRDDIPRKSRLRPK